MRCHVMFTVLLSILGSVLLSDAFRDCFFCDSRHDTTAGRACDWKKPDMTKMSAVRMPDDEEECHVCAKFLLPAADNAVIRGCLTISSWQGTMRNLGFTDKDQCKEMDDGRIYCVCKESLCNGANKTVFSLTGILLSMLYFVL